MKRKNLQLLSVLFLIITLISFQKSYSQWTLAGTVSNVGSFPSISVVDQNTAWITSAALPLIYRTINGGTTWTSIPVTGVSLEGYCIWARDANTCYVGDGGGPGGTGGNAQLYKTTDAGATPWTVAASTGGTAGFFNGVVFSKTMPTFGIAQSDPPTGAGSVYYISITTNGGTNWNPLTPAPPGIAGAASAQNSVIVVDNMFYGFGLNAGAARVNLTSNGGSSWFVGNLGITGTFVSGFAFSDDKLVGIASTDASLPSIARTTNGGTTWSTVNIGTGVTGYCTMKWIPGTNTCYLSGAAGAGGVVKKSTNGGLNWTTMTTSGLTGITHMEFARVGTTVYGYAATSSGAVLKVTDMVTEVSSTNNLIPDQFKLEQNYPNPFNPTTTINFSIPTASKVTLKVYDALGKEVANLVDEFKQAGNYSSDFTAGANLNSGVYFYTLRTDNFADTKKLMLVK